MLKEFCSKGPTTVLTLGNTTEKFVERWFPQIWLDHSFLPFPLPLPRFPMITLVPFQYLAKHYVVSSLLHSSVGSEHCLFSKIVLLKSKAASWELNDGFIYNLPHFYPFFTPLFAPLWWDWCSLGDIRDPGNSTVTIREAGWAGRWLCYSAKSLSYTSHTPPESTVPGACLLEVVRGALMHDSSALQCGMQHSVCGCLTLSLSRWLADPHVIIHLSHQSLFSWKCLPHAQPNHALCQVLISWLAWLSRSVSWESI